MTPTSLVASSPLKCCIAGDVESWRIDRAHHRRVIGASSCLVRVEAGRAINSRLSGDAISCRLLMLTNKEGIVIIITSS